jgi:hypothetical protein
MLKVAELRAELAKRGLSTDGQKEQLRTRLTAAVGEEARQAVLLAARLSGKKREGVDFISPLMGGTKRARAVTCKKMKDCKKYLETLGLDPSYFDEDEDRCYCGQCSASLPPYMERGDEKYELPLGWCGFGLAVPARAKALDVFSKWHVSYHGTSPEHISSILAEGGLLMPGDKLLNGKTLGAIHTRDTSRQKIYTSPSIFYSELEVYTERHFAQGQRVRVVLQCQQQPNYETCGETVGWNRKHPSTPISPYFENKVIERITESKNSVIPYRILVKFSSLFDDPAAQVLGPQVIRLCGVPEASMYTSLQGLYTRMNVHHSKGFGNRPVYRSVEHDDHQGPSYVWYCPAVKHWHIARGAARVGSANSGMHWKTESETPVGSSETADATWRVWSNSKHLSGAEGWNDAPGMRFETCRALTLHITGLPRAHPCYSMIVGEWTLCEGDLVNGAPVYNHLIWYLWFHESGRWMMGGKDSIGELQGFASILTETKRNPWHAMSTCAWEVTLPSGAEEAVWADVDAGRMSVQPTSKCAFYLRLCRDHSTHSLFRSSESSGGQRRDHGRCAEAPVQKEPKHAIVLRPAGVPVDQKDASVALLPGWRREE